MIAQFILPANVQLRADSIYAESGVIYIDTSAYQGYSVCPVCNRKSGKIHSRYCRTLLDLPISGHLSKVKLKARKYFCDNTECPRKVFTERFDYQIKPYCRRMIRSNDLLVRMGIELGGNTGSATSRSVGIPVSPSTILRLIKRLEVQSKIITSGVIGIDDWAFKKGKTYGTVIVDLERKEVVDLLPDRESGTLTEWLKGHPEIRIVSRDRYGPYALGVKAGAPNAIQVADRFHLLMNLADATKRMLQSKGKELREIFTLYNDTAAETSDLVNSESLLQNTTERISTTAHISIDKQHKFDIVKDLYSKGISIRKIARNVQLTRATVKRYTTMQQLVKRQSRSTTNLDAFIDFLSQQDNRGKTYRELHRTITAMGFNGKYTQFCCNMKEIYAKQPYRKPGPASPILVKTWSPTRLSHMLYLEADELKKDDDKVFLKLLLEKCPQIRQAEKLVKGFKKLFIEKQDGMLKNWIEQVLKSDCGLKHFAKNLVKDYDAVNNAVTTTISNGQVEGQVNRIKNIKRKMYGKASFQLLRKMVLAKSI
ncbi:MAG TPA: ISL3 family transposase [Dyadobacter sp.]|jgi:transposase|nr:ISL3 family transposase [Dyadobacter sp.]